MYKLTGKFMQPLVCTIAAFTLLIQSDLQAKPTLKGADLLCNGESFFAASNICSELTKLAQADGVLPSSESFKQVAVSGVPISTVLSQFKNANPKPKFVVTDGGGIDLMSNNCTTGDVNCTMVQNLKNTMIQYIAEMKKSGVKAFIWMCYPDPQGSSWATLKKGQDIWAIVAKQVMDTTTAPKALWVDLRPVWQGHYSAYTTDGIHCTTAGGTATAQAFWNAMKANDYAFFDTTKTTATQHFTNENVMHSSIQGQFVKNGTLSVSLFLRQPSNVSFQLMDVSGRIILTTQRQVSMCGDQTVQFSLGAIASGMYCLHVQAGGMIQRSMVMVP